MSQHARIEEVSDSDLESDPSEQDLEDFAPTSLPRPSAPTVPTPSPAQHAASSPPASDLKIKKYQCIYPLYFDANRSRAQGRRVGKKLAVWNPLAREIVDAVQLLGLDTVFEPGKTHPKDWSNPGRVRVLVKENGSARNRAVQNSRFSFLLPTLYLWPSQLPPNPIPSIAALSHDHLPPFVSKKPPEAYRTPPLHPRLQASPHQPYKPRIPSPPTYPGYAPPRTSPPDPRHPSRLENEYGVAAPLARAERRRSQRQHHQGYDAGDSGRAGRWVAGDGRTERGWGRKD